MIDGKMVKNSLEVEGGTEAVASAGEGIDTCSSRVSSRAGIVAGDPFTYRRPKTLSQGFIAAIEPRRMAFMRTTFGHPTFEV